MQVSLNEIQVESRKAARGAGLSWGLAEEAGQAMAWLAEQGVDAVPALLDVLAQVSVASDDSPIRIGAEIVDRAGELAADTELSFRQIRQPILILPFLAMAARLIGRGLILQHAAGRWAVAPDAVEQAVLQAAAGQQQITAVSCHADSSRVVASARRAQSIIRLDIEEVVWRRLQAFAHMTYVPASDLSRRLGAGAGTIDND
jgi:hypothetical protein